MTEQQQSTGKEMGLIKTLSSRNYELANTKEKINTIHSIATRSIYKYGGITGIWEYMDEVKIWGQALRMSHIKDYINTKGENTGKAHFNENDKFYGKCSKKGDIPIMIPTGCVINKEEFEYFPEENEFIYKKITVKKIIKRKSSDTCKKCVIKKLDEESSYTINCEECKMKFFGIK